MPIDPARPFVPCNIAIVTVSDSRGESEDSSGHTLVQRATAAVHRVVFKRVVEDDLETIRGCVTALIADAGVDVVITTGGTGVTGRDVTPEALEGLYDKAIVGFGELFRWLSYQSIGTSTIQSRATAGVAGRTYLFGLPGSTGACRDAWDGILQSQLDSRHRPCNLVELLPRLAETSPPKR